MHRPTTRTTYGMASNCPDTVSNNVTTSFDKAPTVSAMALTVYRGRALDLASGISASLNAPKEGIKTDEDSAAVRQGPQCAHETRSVDHAPWTMPQLVRRFTYQLCTGCAAGMFSAQHQDTCLRASCSCDDPRTGEGFSLAV